MLQPRPHKYKRPGFHPFPLVILRRSEEQSRAARDKIQFIPRVRLLPILTLRRA